MRFLAAENLLITLNRCLGQWSHATNKFSVTRNTKQACLSYPFNLFSMAVSFCFVNVFCCCFCYLFLLSFFWWFSFMIYHDKIYRPDFNCDREYGKRGQITLNILLITVNDLHSLRSAMLIQQCNSCFVYNQCNQVDYVTILTYNTAILTLYFNVFEFEQSKKKHNKTLQ